MFFALAFDVILSGEMTKQTFVIDCSDPKYTDETDIPRFDLRLNQAIIWKGIFQKEKYVENPIFFSLLHNTIYFFILL